MMTFLAIFHIVIAVLLIALVLIQDSKESGAMGIGGGGSNSLLGATGAQTLAARLTRWTAVLFACSCIGLTLMTAQKSRSVIDSLPAAAPVVPPVNTPADAAPAGAPAAAAPTATPEAPAAK